MTSAELSVDFAVGARPERLSVRSRWKSMPASTAQEVARSLLEAFIYGEDSAFEKLYAEYQQRLFAYAARMTFDEDAAQDIAQQAWLRIIQLRNDPSRLREIRNVPGFLITVVRNLALDHLRRTTRSTSLEGLEDISHADVEGESGGTGNIDTELLHAALKSLSPETREILVLHYYSGFGFDEIADMLGKKPNAIWTRVSRARMQLRELLEAEVKRSERRIGE